MADSDAKRASIPKLTVGSYVRARLPQHSKGEPALSKPVRILRRVGRFSYLLETGEKWHARKLTPAETPSDSPVFKEIGAASEDTPVPTVLAGVPQLQPSSFA